jgi:hypothetical protein
VESEKIIATRIPQAVCNRAQDENRKRTLLAYGVDQLKYTQPSHARRVLSYIGFAILEYCVSLQRDVSEGIKENLS